MAVRALKLRSPASGYVTVKTAVVGAYVQPGTELFVVSVDPGDADVVWLNEWFRDDEALQAHRAAPAFADLIATMPALLSGPAGILRIDPLRLDLAGPIAAGRQIDGLPQ